MTPKIGVIADDNLQGHLLSSAVTSQGFELAVNTEPGKLDNSWFSSGELGLWLVDLTDEDKWSDFLDQLLDSPVPILFCDGLAPARNTEGYPHWERRLLAKILSYVPKPALPAEPLDALSKTSHITIPQPPEFKTTDLNQQPQRICVLGASMGGPQAIKQFLDCLPAGLPVAFLLAQHIDQMMLDTLGKVLCRDNHYECRIAYDGESLRYGRVLIAPITYEITFSREGRIYSTGKQWEGPYSPSIDQTIANATQCFGDQASAILFSGMGNDGAIAAPKLAAQGGAVWAQSAASCIISSQPDATRETGCVTFNGTPDELALQLVQQVKQSLIATA